MDPQTNLSSLVEDLEVNIDELTSALSPLLTTPLSTTASSLPLLDKAKLYVLAVYSIESLLFSTLQASGANAKSHAVFAELARLRNYFAKIKEVEERGAAGQSQKAPRLNVAAAQRFIKHGLAGNEKYDAERAERIAKEKARAAVKAAMLHRRFDDGEEEVKMREAMMGRKRGVEEDSGDGDAVAALEGALAEPEAKKARLEAESAADTDSAPSTKKTKRDKGKKKNKSKAKISATTTYTSASSPTLPSDPQDAAMPDAPDTPTSTTSTSTPTSTKRRRRRKAKGIKKVSLSDHSDNEEAILPDQVLDTAPKTRSETFSALLDGSLADKKKKEKGRGKKEKKGKRRG